MKRAIRPIAIAGLFLSSACGPAHESVLAAQSESQPTAAKCIVSLWPVNMGEANSRTVDVNVGGPDRTRTLGSATLAMPDAVTLEITPQTPLTLLPEDGTVLDLGVIRAVVTSSCRHTDANGLHHYTTYPNMTNSDIVLGGSGY